MSKTIKKHVKNPDIEECYQEYNKQAKKKMTRKQYANSPEGRLMQAIYGKV